MSNATARDSATNRDSATARDSAPSSDGAGTGDSATRVARNAGRMRRWAEVAEAIRATRKTSRKTAIVAEYVVTLNDADLARAVVFLSGHAFPASDGRRTGLGWAAISAVAQEIAGAGEGALRKAYDRSSDLGTSVQQLLGDVNHRPTPRSPVLMLGDVAAAYDDLAQARGKAAKGAVLAGLLRRSDPLCARHITAILSGELRIGLREGHLESGIAQAFGRDLADVQWADMLSGDIGRTAQLARDDALPSARLSLFHPLKSMLATAVADEAEALRRLTPPLWVEDKYDGIRAQLHKQGSAVRLFSRDLNDVTAQFPEIVRAAAQLPWDGILDGEVLGWKSGAALPFLQLQARLGRKKPSQAMLEEVPVIYVAFDALALGSPSNDSADPGRQAEPIEPLLRLRLRERRRRLEGLGLARIPGFGLAALMAAEDEQQLERIFAAAQERGNEGLMLKDPESTYSPGRRGYAWLKLKKALTTLDCVVVGVEVGHGRRHGVLSDYTFAVIDDRATASEGALVNIGKAYSGLTDAEIAEMTRWFEAHTVSQHGRFRVVEPRVVVEIAFDVVHSSTRHASGFALRFPRIVRIRDDKGASEIDRLSTVAALHERLQDASMSVKPHAPRSRGAGR
ncbi:MAG: ATP-dependent DNA ligase, partial [Chloroflexota bacterium]